jgi:hypothetical protein
MRIVGSQAAEPSISVRLAPNGLDLSRDDLFHGRSFRVTADKPINRLSSPSGLSRRKED